MIAVHTGPFGVVTTTDDRWSFVGTSRGIMVLSGDRLALRAVRTIATEQEPFGVTLTRKAQIPRRSSAFLNRFPKQVLKRLQTHAVDTHRPKGK